MATMSLSLPDPMKGWVEAQIRTGAYGGAYVRDLIRRDHRRAGKAAELQSLITEGRESGVSDRSMAGVLRMARLQAVIVQKP